ncbi:MAG: hypothetical protein EHM46_03255 [Bacteroidetes bacterium]|nr:MAG: hypothetical protein EHM46_03255 [Bacteroidota bacterium]
MEKAISMGWNFVSLKDAASGSNPGSFGYKQYSWNRKKTALLNHLSIVASPFGLDRKPYLLNTVLIPARTDVSLVSMVILMYLSILLLSAESVIQLLTVTRIRGKWIKYMNTLILLGIPLSVFMFYQDNQSIGNNETSFMVVLAGIYAGAFYYNRNSTLGDIILNP